MIVGEIHNSESDLRIVDGFWSKCCKM